MNIKVPTTRRQVRSLLGLLNFFRQFVPKYTDIMACLTELITHCEEVSSKPFLRIPDLSLDFHIFYRCLDYWGRWKSLSALWWTIFSNQVHQPKADTGRKADTQHWSVSDQGCLAVSHCLNKWNRFLCRRHFYVYSDHKCLSVLPTGNVARSRRMHSWAIMLSQYNFTQIFVPAGQNRLADLLSCDLNCHA